MIKIFTYVYIILSIFFINSCSEKKLGQTEGKIIISPQILYADAKKDLDDGDYLSSIQKFTQLREKFSLSNEGVQAEIMIAFIHYLKMDYEETIYELSKFIKKYPSHKDIDYAYYVLGLSYYEQINHEELDGKNNNMALEYFTQILKRFPKSNYSKDSQQKIIFIKENIAAKNLNIANFYLDNEKYIAALNRFKFIVENHSTSKFVPEALHRMVEIYFALNLISDAEKTASIIAFNYPDSKWYKYSYDLLKPIEKKTKEKKSFFKKLTNILDDNEKKEQE